MVTINLIYHRKERKSRVHHVQSFLLCDIQHTFEGIVYGTQINILKSTPSGFTHWEGNLRAGSYVLIPFSISFWHDQDKPKDFTLVIHSNISVVMNLKKQTPEFLANCLISYVVKNHDHRSQVQRTRIIFR